MKKKRKHHDKQKEERQKNIEKIEKMSSNARAIFKQRYLKYPVIQLNMN